MEDFHFKSILIVDDDDGILELFKSTCEDMSYEVYLENKSSLVKDRINQHKPSLMILDYNMPDLNGKELIKNLEELNLNIPPFIVTTGHGDEEIAVDMMKLGAKDYLVKDASILSVLPKIIKRVENDLRNQHELNQAQIALKVSEEKFRNILENNQDVAYKFDIHSKKFVYMSPSSSEVLGYSLSQINKMTYSDFQEYVQKDDLLQYRQTIQNLIAGNKPKTGSIIEYRWKHSDNSIKWLSDSINLVDENNQPRAIIGNIRDITEKKKFEEEKNKLQTQLVQAQKMEAIGRLAGGIAHDFNNMLSIIMGNSQLALSHLDEKSEKVKGEIEEIFSAAKRSAVLTKQLLTFARKEKISPVVMNLNETVEGMLKMLRRLIGENIELIWKPKTDLWKIKMDNSQIDQLLANLCINAKDSIENFGQISISTENVKFSDIKRLGDFDVTQVEYVKLSLTDNGKGIKKEHLKEIFEPFFTTKSLGKGTGLGLATVYGIIKQNNGLIDVSSDIGIGTTFSLYFPRVKSETKETESEFDIKLYKGSETILFVEDEKPILKMTKSMLQVLGYKVITASDPFDALDIAQNYSESIHLLLTDVIMPRMNGKELATKIKKIYPDIKVLFMSGYTADILSSQGDFGGDIKYLQKPFILRTLAESVRKTLSNTF